ncbi:MAG: dipeptidase [Bacteroidales bacterium]|nr:dipeptidase [Bacteroidales bacterium]HPB05651.1 dipeptidase [Prolixibacteraceae bacterium]
MNSINQFIEENKNRFLDELFSLIRIPSISAEKEHRDDMYKAANRWKELLLEAGANKAEVLETAGNPVTFAEKIIDASLPTILVYAHMDVMPVDPVDLWKTTPFEPVIQDGKIWARGADDDKGQSFIHAKAFEYMVKTNTLPCNVKFIIEGEEEIGSPSLAKFCEDNKEMLKADVILVSDTTMVSPDQPAVTTGLRGLTYWDVEVTGPNRDLHSGLFGGAVANPIVVLSQMIAKCLNPDNSIAIANFNNDVAEVSAEERELLNRRPFNADEYKKAIGVDELSGEEGYTTTERTGIRPSFDVCGIWGGYTGEGTKTVLPSVAHAKISCRLVPNQNFQQVSQLLNDYFQQIAPKSVKVKVTYLHGGNPYVCPIDHPAYVAAEKALIDVFGKQPIPVRSGGSIPIITTFEEILGIKSILIGFGLDGDAIHSPNESFPLENLWNGIRTIPNFYRYFAELNAVK